MLEAQDVVARLSAPGLGFERVDLLPGSTYRDNSTVIVIPTRGMIHHRVVAAWQGLIAPMNQKRAILFAAGDMKTIDSPIVYCVRFLHYARQKSN
jgi:hypothetical protein